MPRGALRYCSCIRRGRATVGEAEAEAAAAAAEVAAEAEGEEVANSARRVLIGTSSVAPGTIAIAPGERLAGRLLLAPALGEVFASRQCAPACEAESHILGRLDPPLRCSLGEGQSGSKSIRVHPASRNDTAPKWGAAESSVAQWAVCHEVESRR